MYFHRLRAGLDAEGRLVAWQHRIVGQSIARGTPFAAGMIHNGIDHTSVEGASTLPYLVPDITVDLHTTDVGVPVLRSEEHTSELQSLMRSSYAVFCLKKK